jgi:hypothetical protein
MFKKFTAYYEAQSFVTLSSKASTMLSQTTPINNHSLFTWPVSAQSLQPLDYRPLQATWLGNWRLQSTITHYLHDLYRLSRYSHWTTGRYRPHDWEIDSRQPPYRLGDPPTYLFNRYREYFPHGTGNSEWMWQLISISSRCKELHFNFLPTFSQQLIRSTTSPCPCVYVTISNVAKIFRLVFFSFFSSR